MTGEQQSFEQRLDETLAKEDYQQPATGGPARAVESAKSDTVHCSNCGKRVSGNDSEMGLVVRAWVECPECVQNSAAEREPLERRIERVQGLLNTALTVVRQRRYEVDALVKERDALAERVSNRDAVIASITQQRDFAVAVIEARDALAERVAELEVENKRLTVVLGMVPADQLEAMNYAADAHEARDALVERVRALGALLTDLAQATQDPEHCTLCLRNPTIEKHKYWCMAGKAQAALAAAAPPAQQCKHDWVPSLRVIDPINPYPEVRGHHCSKCGAAEPSDAVRVAERRVIEAARLFSYTEAGLPGTWPLGSSLTQVLNALNNTVADLDVINGRALRDDAASQADPPEARQGEGAGS